MSKKEEIFKELIYAFNHFLDVDEKEIGCLTEEEHERMCNDVNYYSNLFARKMKKNTNNRQQKTEVLNVLLKSNDDDGGEVELCKKHLRDESEFEM